MNAKELQATIRSRLPQSKEKQGQKPKLQNGVIGSILFTIAGMVSLLANLKKATAKTL